MQDNKSKLADISKSDKVKRAKLIAPVELKKRSWLGPLVLFIKIWCILRGRGPSKATIEWLAKYGVKRIIGTIRADDGKNKKGS